MSHLLLIVEKSSLKFAILTLKAPSKIAADDTFIFLLLSFEENKA